MSLCALIQIGPPNSQFLKAKDKKTWTAKDVADSVLSDKSALVIEPACLIRLALHVKEMHFGGASTLFKKNFYKEESISNVLKDLKFY